jgi:hypothetical protein
LVPWENAAIIIVPVISYGKYLHSKIVFISFEERNFLLI